MDCLVTEYFFPESLLLEVLLWMVGEGKNVLFFLFCRTKVTTWWGVGSQMKKDVNALENMLHLEL